MKRNFTRREFVGGIAGLSLAASATAAQRTAALSVGSTAPATIPLVNEPNLRWKVGDVTITRILQVMLHSEPNFLMPLATPQGMARHESVRKWALDADGKLLVSIHTLCVEADGKKIVVDTCNGPGRTNGSFLAALSAAGFGRDDVDLVICTHQHMDHIGWNTLQEDGQYVPTFPKARYLLVRPEYEHWAARSEEQRHRYWVNGFEDAVMPLVKRGVADLVQPDHVLSNTIRLVSTPGHSPGHVSVLITSKGERALLTGDVAHSPLQFMEPSWFIISDSDRDMSSETRIRVREEYADSGVLIIAAHFPPPSAGHFVKTKSGVQIEPIM